MQCETSISEDKASSNPSKSYHERKTTQLLESEKSLFSGNEPIFISFPRKNGQASFGMQIGGISCQPTYVQEMSLDAMGGSFESVTRTSHPNLLNLIGISARGGEVSLHYEKPGIPLTKIRQIMTLDRIEVATICKKVLFKIHFLHQKQ
jgi:hypothetical protein